MAIPKSMYSKNRLIPFQVSQREIGSMKEHPTWPKLLSGKHVGMVCKYKGFWLEFLNDDGDVGTSCNKTVSHTHTHTLACGMYALNLGKTRQLGAAWSLKFHHVPTTRCLPVLNKSCQATKFHSSACISS